MVTPVTSVFYAVLGPFPAAVIGNSYKINSILLQLSCHNEHKTLKCVPTALLAGKIIGRKILVDIYTPSCIPTTYCKDIDIRPGNQW